MFVRKTYPLLAVNCRRFYLQGVASKLSACEGPCRCSRLTEREFSTKIRDVKDFNRYASRPDDPPKRKPIVSKTLPNNRKIAARDTRGTSERAELRRREEDNRKIDQRPIKTERRPIRPLAPKCPDIPASKDLSEQWKLRLKDRSVPLGPVTCNVKATVEKTILRQRGSIRTSLVKITPDEAPTDRKTVDTEINRTQSKSVSLDPDKGSQFDGLGGVISAGLATAAGKGVSLENKIADKETIKKSVLPVAKKIEGFEAKAAEKQKPDDSTLSKIRDSASREAGQPAALASDKMPKAEQSQKSQPEDDSDRPEVPTRAKRMDVIIDVAPAFKIVRHSFVHSRRHRIYTSGLTDTGALGLHRPGKEYRYRVHVARPMRQAFAEENRVITAETGFGFTLFYIKNDETVKLYGCGLNSEFQLGANEQQIVTYPVPVDIRLNSPKTKLLSISCGRAHSAVATDAEGVFLFGCNRYGQCGRQPDGEDADVSNDTCMITQMKSLEGESVSSVVCGQDHTLFLTEGGRVFSCGCGSEGQTGLGHALCTDEPELVEGDIKNESIVRMAGKCDTVLALNDKGEVFGWGSNEFRQLSNDLNLAHVPAPVRLEQVNKKCGRVVDIAAGSSFCLTLNEDGDVFVWGQGILGGGPDLYKTTVPVLLPRTLFGCNEYTPKVRSMKVFCGVDHMMVINNLKHVYAWGKNKHGCLGIGFLRDQYFPYKLAISAEAVHVSCAVDHSIILANHDLQ